MIKVFSQKLTPPFSGQVHIAETETYRALTMDALNWEIQYVNRSHIRVARFSSSDIKSRSLRTEQHVDDVADPKLGELLDYLAVVKLPFKAVDYFEYWLLDHAEKKPLALLFSCTKADHMKKFPNRAIWTALPDAVMPIEKTDQEIKSNLPPVNYRLESRISELAGTNPKAQWFDRREPHDEKFPSLLIRDDWQDENDLDLYKRYTRRQAPRLLMLQGLETSQREYLESCCEPYATEVARLSGLYPQIIDESMFRALKVEARLRELSGTDSPSSVQNRRDGVLYI